MLEGVKRDVASGAAWVAGAGISGIIGYFIATASAGGVHPDWPYLVFAALAAAGVWVYLANRQDKGSRHSSEAVVYSSEKSRLVGNDFTGEGSQLWNGKEHAGGNAHGKLTFVGDKKEIVNLVRTNNDGKYKLGLRRYNYGGQISDILPGNLAISGKRRLRVRGEVKTAGGPHRLVLRWNPPKDGYRLAEKEILVAGDSWTAFDEYFQVDPSRDCYLRIDDHYQTGPTPSALQLRRIIVSEEIAEE
jgi:hypothetical protein